MKTTARKTRQPAGARGREGDRDEPEGPQPVSRMDVLSVYECPDEQIGDEITRGVIAGRFRLDPFAFEVAVRSGIVTITGHANKP